MRVKWEHISLLGLELHFRVGSLNHELGLKGFLALSKSIRVCMGEGRLAAWFPCASLCLIKSSVLTNLCRVRTFQTQQTQMLSKYLAVRQTSWTEFKCILEKRRSLSTAGTWACTARPWCMPALTWEASATAWSVQVSWKCGWRAGSRSLCSFQQPPLLRHLLGYPLPEGKHSQQKAKFHFLSERC